MRRLRLVAQRAALRVQYAQQQLEELVLELKRSYGTLTKDTVLDMQTGIIQARNDDQNDRQTQSPNGLQVREEAAHGPANDAD